MNWSPQQDRALRLVAQWMRDPRAPQVFYLAGVAGTGKTSVAKHLVDGKWLFAAYTGKAAHVLSTRGCAGARTIHSLVYRFAGEVSPEEIQKLERELASSNTSERRRLAIARDLDALRDQGPRFALWESGPLSLDEVDGVVLDEVSMLDHRLVRDVKSFGKKVLALGDPEQLPPVHGCGYFTALKPDVMLTEVHRQAKDSGVIRLATHIREGGSLSTFDSAPDAEILSQRSTPQDVRTAAALEADQVLVGKNKTRHDLNRRYRTLRQRTGVMPYEGDRLVCLRNERERGLFNGSQWNVVDAKWQADRETGELTVRSEDDDRIVVCDAWVHHLQNRGHELKRKGAGVRDASEFDWGYALTVHKAQGSEWDRVLVVDESRSLGGTEPRRWLYTAATRAAKHVTILT